MYTIITPDMREQHADLLDQMFRARHDLFVKEMKWNIPNVKAPYEKDEFDTDDTVYIVVVDPDLNIVTCSSRLNPTTKPHLLTDVFPHYCQLQDIPVGEHIWEWSRQQVSSKYYPNPVDELRLRTQIPAGINDFCLANGITKLSTLTHSRGYNVLQRIYNCEPLGLPNREPGEDMAWIAAIVDIDEHAINNVKFRTENPELVFEQMVQHKAAKKVRAA